MSGHGDVEQAHAELRRAWKEAHLVPLWESPTAHKPPPPPTPSHLWSWQTLRPLIEGAIEMASPTAVERRVLSLVNPRSRSPEDELTTKNLSAAIQILLPGRVGATAPTFHERSALRAGRDAVPHHRKREGVSHGVWGPHPDAGLDMA